MITMTFNELLYDYSHFYWLSTIFYSFLFIIHDDTMTYRVAYSPFAW